MTLQAAPKLPHFRPVIGHEELYGRRLSFEEAGRFLESLKPEYVLASSALLTALAVQDEDDVDELRMTAKGLQLLFPRDRIERIEQKRRRFRKSGTELAVIGEHQLIVLARLALLRARGSLHPDAGDEWKKKMSSALLAVNDIASAPATVDSGALGSEWTPEQQLLAYRMFLPQHATIYNEDVLHALARAKRMFVELPSEMRDDHDWIDFPAVVEARHGATSRELIMCATFLMWSFSTLLVRRQPQSIPRGILTRLGFEQRVADAAMRVFSQTFDEAAAEEAKLLAATGRFEPFDARTFLTKPIVYFEDRMVAPSNRFTMKAANIGLYYMLLDSVPDEQKRSQAFFNFTGRIFERYCHELLGRLAAATGALYLGELLPDVTGKRGDGAVVDADGSVTLFEFKGGMFNVRAGMLAEEQPFERSFDGLILKAVIQLRDTLRSIRSGGQLIEGRATRPRFAIVVTQYPFSTDFMLEEVVRDRMRARGESMSEFDGVPLLFLNIGELERLEPILSPRAWRLGILFDDWAQSLPRVSFHNFAYTKKLFSKRHAWLEQIANEWVKPWTERVNELAAVEKAVMKGVAT
jgi:hypothetical protein